MKKLLLIALSCLSISLVQASGFDGTTLVTTSSGRLKPIRELSVGDQVLSHGNDFNEKVSNIKGITAFIADSTIRVTTEDGISLVCSALEKFFVLQDQSWICAKDLRTGDCILNEDLDAIRISNVTVNNQKQILYVITLDETHNFMASEGKYIVHNGAAGAAVGVAVGSAGTWVAFEGVYFGIGAAVGTVTGPAGAYIARTAVKTVCAPVQYAAMKTVGLACGVALGVATGPV